MKGIADEVLQHQRYTCLIEFGDLRAFLTPHLLIVIHRNDRHRAFVTPVLGSPAQTLAEHLPGVPAIAAILALETASAVENSWPFSQAVAPPVLITSDDNRLTFASVNLGDQRSVSIKAEPIDPGNPAEWGLDLSGRHRVASAAELAQHTDVVSTERTAVGDDAPTLLLLAIDMTPWILSARDDGAVAIVLCRAQTPGAAAGFGAALDVSEDADAPHGYSPILAVCGEPFTGQFMDHLRELRRTWGRRVMWTVSQETTIDLFAPDQNAVLVVIDAFDTVRAIIPLDGRGAEETEIAQEIRAALATQPK